MYDNEIEFDFYTAFNNRYVKTVVSLNNKKALVDRDGTFILDFGIVDNFHEISSYYTTFEQNKKYGAYNNNGELILEPIFDSIQVYIEHDFLIANKSTESYLYNANGEILYKADSINYIAEWAWQLPDIKNYFEIINNNKTDIFLLKHSVRNNEKIETKEECFIFKEKRMLGVKDKNNNIILPNIFTDISICHQFKIIRCNYYCHNNSLFYDFSGNEILDDDLIFEYANTSRPPHYYK